MRGSYCREGVIRLGVLTATAALVVALLVPFANHAAATPGAPRTPTGTSVISLHTRGSRALVPASIKARGILRVATDASYAPLEFIDPHDHTVVGMDADLAAAVASVLGLKVKLINAKFDSIILGLTSRKYDLGMSSFTDTKARETQVNFVTYFSAGTSFYEKAAGGPPVTGLSSLCGLKVAVELGTTQQADAAAQANKCAANPATVLVFPDQNGANLALSAGRVQVGMADSPVAAYAVKQAHGQFKLVGQTYGEAPYGIAVAKSSDTLDRALLSALKVLIRNGRYRSILRKWGIQSGAVAHPVINGAKY